MTPTTLSNQISRLMDLGLLLRTESGDPKIPATYSVSDHGRHIVNRLLQRGEAESQRPQSPFGNVLR